jgi:hypothetical protein
MRYFMCLKQSHDAVAGTQILTKNMQASIACKDNWKHVQRVLKCLAARYCTHNHSVIALENAAGAAQPCKTAAQIMKQT